MKNYIIPFLIITVLTGIIGFGWSFKGVEFIRIAFLIFADLLIISVLARFFFSDPNNMRMERIRK